MILLHPIWLAAAAIALALFFLLRARAQHDDWNRVMSRDVLRFLIGADQARRGRDLTLLALAATFAALTSPAIRAPAQSFVPAEGVVIIVDVSRSMTLGDIRPSRLSAARAIAMALAADAGAKPVALIVFAGDAYMAQPFSRDRSQLNSFIAKVEHGLIEHEGSGLERALALTQSVLRQSGMAASRLVLLSDAGGVSIEAIALAAELHKAGARLDGIFTIGQNADTPDQPDVAGFGRLIGAGGGIVLNPDEFGVADISKLDLGGQSGMANYSLLNTPTTDWRNLSHWLLLAAAPLFLLLFRQRAS
jgi:Ca-activated chloride channel family protein